MASSSRLPASTLPFIIPARQSSFLMPSSSGEFKVEVEVFLSRTAYAAMKSSLTRTRAEKRDSLRHANSSSDLSGQRSVLKDAASLLGMSRLTEEADQWRPAICKLWEQDQGCFLHVYRDNTALYQSIYVHTLNHTDIRPVHRSLFDCKNCLGIFYSSNQIAMNISPKKAETPEPLILRFPDEELMQLWIALLRSYGQPEVYGRGLNQRDGGLYRMWRQVGVECMEARNLGSLVNEAGDKLIGGSGLDAFCTFAVDGVDAGRTTVIKTLDKPVFLESFVFTDLPPFEALDVTVWDKKSTKAVMVGTATIPLMNFRRGEQLEGWFPLLDKRCTVIGEIRLKIRVDEEIILPLDSYSGVLEAMEVKNHLGWISELNSKLGVSGISDQVLEIALCRKKLVDDIMELAEHEVSGNLKAANVIFRGNSTFTRTMESFMHICGAQWLEASIGPVLRRVCAEKVFIETDPTRLPQGAKHAHLQEANIKLLIDWCQKFLKSIYDARDQCPYEMRQLFQCIRTLLEQQSDGMDQSLVYQLLSSFVFLRFFVPSIMTPHIRGFWPGLTDDRVRRSLTLIARAVQSLANLVKSVQQEWETPVNDYLAQNADDMINYLKSISSPRSGAMPPPSLPPDGVRARTKVRNALQRRLSLLPVLYREAVTRPPYMIDLGKNLAAVTAVIVRHTRRNLLTRLDAPSELELNVLCSECLAVEEQAVTRVSRIAARRNHSNPVDAAAAEQPFIRTPISPTKPEDLPSPRRRTRSKLRKQRPATAPDRSPLPKSPTLPDNTSQPIPSPRNLSKKTSFYESFSDPESSMPPSAEHSSGGEASRPSRPMLSHHSRSASTDSAVTRRSNFAEASSPTMTGACLPFPGDVADNAKRKGLLRMMRK